MKEPKQQSSAVPEPVSEPKWVEEMHGYYQQNGFYRAQDLQRVLGDPREHVTLQTSDEEPINFTVKR